MVLTKVPLGTKSTQNAGSTINAASAGKRCAGEQCSNPVATIGNGGKGGGLDRFCSDCRSSIASVAPNCSQPVSNNDQGGQDRKGISKRPYGDLSPDSSPLDPKKSRVSVRTRDFSVFSNDLETTEKGELIARIKQLISIGQECVAECNVLSSTLKCTEDAFTAYKVAFADEAFKAFTSKCDQVASFSAATRPESSTLVVTVGETATIEQLDTQKIDQLLDAADGGPVPQTVRRKEGKVFISFSDAVQSGRAKATLESKPECLRLFQTVNTQPKLYPAIILNVDVDDLEALKKELVFRNPAVKSSFKKVLSIFRSQNNVTGHAKLFFDDKSIRDTVLKAGRLFAFGRRFRVVEVDLNREVRRCFRCQVYGHIAKSATNACEKDEVCGFCAGAHSTKACARAGQPKCANCSKAHRAGDPLCSHQIRAVNRFRAAIDQ